MLNYRRTPYILASGVRLGPAQYMLADVINDAAAHGRIDLRH